MRNLVIGLAMASTALTAPAMAREGQWYIEGDAGVMPDRSHGCLEIFLEHTKQLFLDSQKSGLAEEDDAGDGCQFCTDRKDTNESDVAAGCQAQHRQ